VRQIAETTSRDGQVEEALQQQFGLVKLDKVRFLLHFCVLSDSMLVRLRARF
jgi:hypothetical protein